MKDTDKVAHRLALLEGVNLSKADLEFIANEIKDLARVVAELEEFAKNEEKFAPCELLRSHARNGTTFYRD